MLHEQAIKLYRNEYTDGWSVVEIKNRYLLQVEADWLVSLYGTH